MDPVPASAVDFLPATADLERAMRILNIPGDPVYVMKDHPDARRRAELLAHIAAGVLVQLGRAEFLAELDVDDRADLHWEADRNATVRLLDLQLARLDWVHHAIVRDRGPRPDQVAGTIATTVGAIGQLVAAWRDGWQAGGGRPADAGYGDAGYGDAGCGDAGRPDPMLADALLMLRDAADHLAGVLRARPTGHAVSGAPGTASWSRGRRGSRSPGSARRGSRSGR